MVRPLWRCKGWFGFYKDKCLTFRALNVSMNFSSSSGGKKSPMKCFPFPISVSCSAHSAPKETQTQPVIWHPIKTAGSRLLVGIHHNMSHCINTKLHPHPISVGCIASCNPYVPKQSLTPCFFHLHLSESVFPGAVPGVNLLIAVVLVLVIPHSLLPHQLHLLHCLLVLHDHIEHLLHLGTYCTKHNACNRRLINNDLIYPPSNAY